MDEKFYDYHIIFRKYSGISESTFYRTKLMSTKRILSSDSLKNVALHSLLNSLNHLQIELTIFLSRVQGSLVLLILSTPLDAQMRFHSSFAIIALLFRTSRLSLSTVFHLVEVSRSVLAVRQDSVVIPSVSGPHGRTRGTSSLGRDEEHDDGGITVSPAVRGRAREEESGTVEGEKK